MCAFNADQDSRMVLRTRILLLVERICPCLPLGAPTVRFGPWSESLKTQRRARQWEAGGGANVNWPRPTCRQRSAVQTPVRAYGDRRCACTFDQGAPRWPPRPKTHVRPRKGQTGPMRQQSWLPPTVAKFGLALGIVVACMLPCLADVTPWLAQTKLPSSMLALSRSEAI
jgi:hypothetical protein